MKKAVIDLNEIERKAFRLLSHAVTMNASDIHLIPRRNDTTIKMRMDGNINDHDIIPNKTSERLISHFKFRAGMDIGERRRPQSGSLIIFMEEKQINLRLSTIPTPFQESLVIRLLPQDDTFSLDSLSIFHQSTRQLLSLLKKPNGLLLITGPTGSGKTTTLYAMLYETMKEFNKNIMTLEDPIEKETDYFLQMELNEKAGLTYVEGLKAILRHDPDIIMVGEIRDDQTAKIAIRAALTGHLVLSTLHTKDTHGAIDRMLEFGVGVHELRQTLIGVVAQRLVELVCPFCQEHCQPFCRRNRTRRRAALYEILAENNLDLAYGGKEKVKILTLADLIRKGIALGYVHSSSYQTWVGELE